LRSPVCEKLHPSHANSIQRAGTGYTCFIKNVMSGEVALLTAMGARRNRASQGKYEQ
jgi:hypothetical protein